MEATVGEFDYEVVYQLDLIHKVPNSLSKLLYPLNTWDCKSIDDEILRLHQSLLL